MSRSRYPKWVRDEAIKLLSAGYSYREVANKLSKAKPPDGLPNPDYLPTERTLRNWLKEWEKKQKAVQVPAQVVETDTKAMPPGNWIERDRATTGELPLVPHWLAPLVLNYQPGARVATGMKLLTPSAQFWANLLPSQKDKLLELVEWLGESPEDYLWKIEQGRPPGGRGGLRLVR